MCAHVDVGRDLGAAEILCTNAVVVWATPSVNSPSASSPSSLGASMPDHPICGEKRVKSAIGFAASASGPFTRLVNASIFSSSCWARTLHRSLRRTSRFPWRTSPRASSFLCFADGSGYKAFRFGCRGVLGGITSSWCGPSSSSSLTT
jgi:hypothetical protein